VELAAEQSQGAKKRYAKTAIAGKYVYIYSIRVFSLRLAREKLLQENASHWGLEG
jgi:hypothetical protein